MADPVEVQRYDKDGFAESDGCYYMHADVAPLLAELATLREQHNELREVHNRAMVVMSTLTTEVLGLRERTRRRDAATEPPPEGVWVLGLTFGYSRVYPAEHVVVRFVKGCWLNADGAERTVLKWWPLPTTEEA